MSRETSKYCWIFSFFFFFEIGPCPSFSNPSSSMFFFLFSSSLASEVKPDRVVVNCVMVYRVTSGRWFRFFFFSFSLASVRNKFTRQTSETEGKERNIVWAFFKNTRSYLEIICGFKHNLVPFSYVYFFFSSCRIFLERNTKLAHSLLSFEAQKSTVLLE